LKLTPLYIEDFDDENKYSKRFGLIKINTYIAHARPVPLYHFLIFKIMSQYTTFDYVMIAILSLLSLGFLIYIGITDDTADVTHIENYMRIADDSKYKRDLEKELKKCTKKMKES
jgi:hypothetical protein